jgi:hypothetical protein
MRIHTGGVARSHSIRQHVAGGAPESFRAIQKSPENPMTWFESILEAVAAAVISILDVLWCRTAGGLTIEWEVVLICSRVPAGFPTGGIRPEYGVFSSPAGNRTPISMSSIT